MQDIHLPMHVEHSRLARIIIQQRINMTQYLQVANIILCLMQDIMEPQNIMMMQPAIRQSRAAQKCFTGMHNLALRVRIVLEFHQCQNVIPEHTMTQWG